MKDDAEQNCVKTKKDLRLELGFLIVSSILAMISYLISLSESMVLQFLGSWSFYVLSLITLVLLIVFLVNLKTYFRDKIEVKQRRKTRWRDIKIWVIIVLVFSVLAAICFFSFLFIDQYTVLRYLSASIILISLLFIGLGVLMIFVKTITFNARIKERAEQSLEHFVVHYRKTGNLIGAFISGGFFIGILFTLDFERLDLWWNILFIGGLFTTFSLCFQLIKTVVFELQVNRDEIRLRTLFGIRVFSIHDIKSVKTKYSSSVMTHPSPIFHGSISTPTNYHFHDLFLYSKSNKTGKLFSVSHSAVGYNLLMERLSEIEALYNDLDPIYRVKKVETEMAEGNMKNNNESAKRKK